MYTLICMNYQLYFSEPNNDDPLNAEAAKYWNKESKCFQANHCAQL